MTTVDSPKRPESSETPQSPTPSNEPPQSIFALCRQAVHWWKPVLLAIWPLLIALVLLKAIYLYVISPIQTTWVVEVLAAALSVISLYLLACAFRLTHVVIQNHDINRGPTFWKAMFPRACRWLLAELIELAVIAVLVVVSLSVAKLLVTLGMGIDLARVLSFAVFAYVPLIFLLIVLWFAGPLIVVDDYPVSQALVESIRLVGFAYWLKVFLLYAILILTLFALSPTTRHGHWLVQHDLLSIVDLIVLGFVFPVLTTLTLLLMRDIQRVRYRMN